MTKAEAVERLDALTGLDPEADHYDADNILLAYVPREVRDAYERVAERCAWWVYA